MSRLNATLGWYLKKRYSKLKQTIDKPWVTQQKIWDRLIAEGALTDWGERYGYDKFRSIEDFQKAVPISHYDDLKPHIIRMMDGERDVLWPGRINMFSKSSGTTSDKSKFIPVSEENLKTCHLRGGWDVISYYYQQFPKAGLFNGNVCIMGGSLDTYENNPDTKFGDVSALMLDNMSLIGKYFMRPKVDIAIMAEWEEKLNRMANWVAKENITHIAGVPTWTIVLFRKILEITGKENMREVWPNIELYIHGGVSFEPYRETFSKFLPGDDIQYQEVYNASEGFFAAQSTWDDSPGMQLQLNHGMFYEFVPMDQWGKDNPDVLTIRDVEEGVNYALLISTNSGLWRYVVGDTVKFSSVYPHKLQVSGRVQHFINVFGEEVMVENTDKAIGRTCQETGALVREYTVAPVYFSAGTKGGHEWIVEFEKPPPCLETFRSKLDLNVQRVNSDYEAKRYKDMALEKLVLHSVPSDTFMEWLKSKGKLGGQNKVPRLSNQRKTLEEILEFSGGLIY